MSNIKETRDLKMKKALLFIILFGLMACSPSLETSKVEPINPDISFYDFSGIKLNGEEVQFSTFKGKVVLVANIALKCGTSYQLKDLQALYEEYKDEGLEIITYPTSDFSLSEPTDSDVIHNTCSSKYGVTYPIFKHCSAKGETINDVFQFLTTSGPEETRGPVVFNLEKFLVGKNGKLRYRFGSFTGVTSGSFKLNLEELLRE